MFMLTQIGQLEQDTSTSLYNYLTRTDSNSACRSGDGAVIAADRWGSRVHSNVRAGWLENEYHSTLHRMFMSSVSTQPRVGACWATSQQMKMQQQHTRNL